MLNLKKLHLLDLDKCDSVSDLVCGMSSTSFGGRMLGEVAQAMVWLVQAHNKPLLVYEGKKTDPLRKLMRKMVERDWFRGPFTVEEFIREKTEIVPTVIMVGRYSEFLEEELFAKAGRIIFINEFGLCKPGQIKDGYFPDVVFTDPHFVLPVIEQTILEHLGGHQLDLSNFLVGASKYGGLAAKTSEAVQTLLAAFHDPECAVFLTLAGAMTIAQMSKMIQKMIDEMAVDYISSTGALMAHGLIQGLGQCHYKYDPGVSDESLRQCELNRVTDTLEPETNFDHLDEAISRVISRLNLTKPIGSIEFHREIGQYLYEKHPNTDAILKSAYVHNIPVSVVALTDSEVGNDLYTTNREKILRGDNKIVFDQERDTDILVQTALSAPRRAIFSIGGGVPRNNTQNVAPLVDLLNRRLKLGLPEVPFYYGVRIDPTPMHFGNLSGATYGEGGSWGKFVFGGRQTEIQCDATIVWPFIMKAVFEKFEGRCQLKMI